MYIFTKYIYHYSSTDSVYNYNDVVTNMSDFRSTSANRISIMSNNAQQSPEVAEEEEESRRERNELEKSLARMRSFILSDSRTRPQTHPVQNKTQM